MLMCVCSSGCKVYIQSMCGFCTLVSHTLERLRLPSNSSLGSTSVATHATRRPAAVHLPLVTSSCDAQKTIAASRQAAISMTGAERQAEACSCAYARSNTNHTAPYGLRIVMCWLMACSPAGGVSPSSAVHAQSMCAL